ncbi:MAG: hypothetical protein ACJASL_002793 [Paraglaciecola sp.]|jgi:hypothetical protein
MQNLYFRLPRQVDDKIKHFSELINQSLKRDISIDISKEVRAGCGKLWTPELIQDVG